MDPISIVGCRTLPCRALAATGQVTFGRYTPTQVAIISPGVTVATGDGSQVFTVIADPGQVTWIAASGCYEIGVGVATASITVEAVNPGTAGNVAVGTISVLSTPISGVDYVTNITALGGGIAAESDSAFRNRFVTFINTRSLATPAAIGYAVTTVPGVASYTLTQNYDYSGAYAPGSFYVVVDDGSGNPPATLITAVSNAVATSAGAGIRFGVLAPVRLTANVSLTVTAGAGFSHSILAAAVQVALTSYIDALPVGAALSFNRLSQIAFDAAPGVSNVSALLLNGLSGDMAASPQQVIRAGTVAVS